jgi:hypothetical protein
MKKSISIAIVAAAVLISGCDKEGSSGIVNPVNIESHRGNGLIINAQLEYTANDRTSIYELSGNAWYSVSPDHPREEFPDERTVSVETLLSLRDIGAYGTGDRIRLFGYGEERVISDNIDVVLTVSHYFNYSGSSAILYVTFEVGSNGLNLDRAWIEGSSGSGRDPDLIEPVNR